MASTSALVAPRRVQLSLTSSGFSRMNLMSHAYFSLPLCLELGKREVRGEGILLRRAISARAASSFLVLDRTVDEVGDLEHFGFLHAAGGDRGSSDTDSAGDHRLLRIERDHVLVDRDGGLVERGGDFLAGGVLRTEVDEHEMVVRAAGNDAEALVFQRLRRGRTRSS